MSPPNAICAWRGGVALLLLLLLLVPVHGAHAADAPTLSGDWGGLRTRLDDRGIALTLVYTSEAANNVRGGEVEKTAYADEWALGASFDLGLLLGINAAKVQITLTDRNGDDLDQTAPLDTLMPVQEIYGRGQTGRLAEFWYQQSWSDDHVVWRMGRLPIGDNFGSFSCNFQNLTFCGSQPGSVRGDYWYNYPVSQWATRVDITVTAQLKLRVGAYQVNPTYADGSWATHNGLLPDNPSGTTGALIPLEANWTPTWLSLPGDYKLGVWYDTSRIDDVYFDIDHQPLVLTGAPALRRRSSEGAYLNIVQQVSGVSHVQGAQIFLNVTQADDETSPSLDRQIALGVQYLGPSGARAHDLIGFGIGTSHVNSRVAANERLLDEYAGGTAPVQSSEYDAELFYGWTPFPFFTVRPNLQYVLHPGGTQAHENEIVVGLKTTVKF